MFRGENDMKQLEAIFRVSKQHILLLFKSIFSSCIQTPPAGRQAGRWPFLLWGS
jgi:hypothetical protein